MDDLPNEIIIEILLKTNNKNELMKICSTSKRIYNLCKTETVAKHIMKNLIKLEKPKVFSTFRGFLKHFLITSKTLHKDIVKDFYNKILPNIIKSKDHSYLEKFRKKFK